jgi:hypothetical protein
MGKVIQMIFISEESSIFIIDFKDNEVTFRSSRIPEQKKVAKIERIDENNMIYFDNYHCNIGYINKFLAENEV